MTIPKKSFSTERKEMTVRKYHMQQAKNWISDMEQEKKQVNSNDHKSN